MKKKTVILMTAAVVGMLVLTACTSSESTEGQAVNTTQLAGGTSNSGSTATDTQGSQTSAANDSTSTGTGDSTAATGTQDVAAPEQGAVAEDDGPQGEVIPDEDANAADAEQETQTGDVWSGTYAGDGETVTIAKLSNTDLSFAFAQAGISGTAAINGTQAVYNGDDHYVVVFNVNDTVLDISVSSEEDYDASESPLNGTYVKAS